MGIILDGNGRFATAQGQPRLFGHEAGFKNIEPIAHACRDNHIDTLTVYAFAIANWKRDKTEVDGLWDLFRYFFAEEVEKIHKENVRVRVIGRRDEIADDVLEKIDQAVESTRDNTGSTLQIALNYDGEDEVVRAFKKLAREIKNGELEESAIDVDLLKSHLDTAGLADPDVVIRTGMPQPESDSGLAMWRSSSFLQLQSSQAVCVSTPVLWPAFSEDDLRACMAFAKPDERLFGGQRK